MTYEAGWHAGLPLLQGNAILDLLFRHMQRPEYGFRYQWNEGDLLIWDQRAVQHYAVRDYEGRRVIHRISVLPGLMPVCDSAAVPRLRSPLA